MIDNNLDHDVALYPYELVTYGETGQVCQNWMQYQLIKRYLEELTDEHTLVTVSYTHLDVYKRQDIMCSVSFINLKSCFFRNRSFG